MLQAYVDKLSQALHLENKYKGIVQVYCLDLHDYNFQFMFCCSKCAAKGCMDICCFIAAFASSFLSPQGFNLNIAEVANIASVLLVPDC